MSMSSAGPNASAGPALNDRFRGSDRDERRTKRARSNRPAQMEINLGQVLCVELGVSDGNPAQQNAAVAAGINLMAGPATAVAWIGAERQKRRGPGGSVLKPKTPECSGSRNTQDEDVRHLGLKPDKQMLNLARNTAEAVTSVVTDRKMTMQQVMVKLVNTRVSVKDVWVAPTDGSEFAYIMEVPTAQDVIACVTGSGSGNRDDDAKCASSCRQMNTNGLLKLTLMFIPANKKKAARPFQTQRPILLKLAKATTDKSGICTSVGKWLSNKIAMYRAGAGQKLCQNEDCLERNDDA